MKKVETKSVSLEIKLARVRLGWRQADLAREAEVSQQDISSIERGLPVYRNRLEKTLIALDL